MSSGYTGPLDRLQGALDELAAIGPEFRSTTEKQQLLVGLSRLIARAEGERLRVLAAADDIAEATGAGSTAAWLATATRDAHGTVRRHASLAAALDTRWTQAGEALAAGTVNLAQARVISEALDALPKDLGADLRGKAEALLVAQAADLGPAELRVFGSRILEYLAPDIAEEAEYERLLAAEARAHAATRLTLRPRGDGSTDLHARLPDHAAGRLRAYLNAFTAPRRHHLHQTSDTSQTAFGPLAPTEADEFAQLPIARQRGEAFVALLEHIPTTSLPRHGGTATSVMVTLDYHPGRRPGPGRHRPDLHRGPDHRRPGPPAGLPGRPPARRPQREERDPRPGPGVPALQARPTQGDELRDRTCTTIGCTIPAAFCKAHHIIPWSRGGTTDLNTGKLLCHFHHHRAHHPDWHTHHHPNGKTSFTRRQ